jgi:hypothetical protein
MKESNFYKKMDAIRKAASKTGVVASSPITGAIKQGKVVGQAAKKVKKMVKKGVKKYKEGLEDMDRARANRDWQYQMGNPNASDFDLSEPKKKNK